jgi:membrane associated rhomboid family serine protease
MGHFRYLVFYLVGGTCAAFAQTIVDPHSMLPMVGASGAIASVLAAYLFLYPRSPITVVNPLLWTIWALLIWGFTWELPAWFVIALWFLLQLFSAFTAQAAGGVAFLAHVGGFVGGALLLRTFMAGRVRLDDYARWQQFARRRSRSEARDSSW